MEPEPPFFAWSRPNLVGAGVGSGTSDFRSRQKKWRLRNTGSNNINVLKFLVKFFHLSDRNRAWCRPISGSYRKMFCVRLDKFKSCIQCFLPFLSGAEATLKFLLRFHFPLQTGRLRLCNSMVVLLCLLIQFYCRCGTPGVRTRTPRCRSSSPL